MDNLFIGLLIFAIVNIIMIVGCILELIIIKYWELNEWLNEQRRLEAARIIKQKRLDFYIKHRHNTAMD